MADCLWRISHRFLIVRVSLFLWFCHNPIWLRIPWPVISSVAIPIVNPSIANRPFQVSANSTKPKRGYSDMIGNSMLVELRWIYVALSLNGLCIYAAFLHLVIMLSCLAQSFSFCFLISCAILVLTMLLNPFALPMYLHAV